MTISEREANLIGNIGIGVKFPIEIHLWIEIEWESILRLVVMETQGSSHLLYTLYPIGWDELREGLDDMLGLYK